MDDRRPPISEELRVQPGPARRLRLAVGDPRRRCTGRPRRHDTGSRLCRVSGRRDGWPRRRRPWGARHDMSTSAVAANARARRSLSRPGWVAVRALSPRLALPAYGRRTRSSRSGGPRFVPSVSARSRRYCDDDGGRDSYHGAGRAAAPPIRARCPHLESGDRDEPMLGARRFLHYDGCDEVLHRLAIAAASSILPLRSLRLGFRAYASRGAGLARAGTAAFLSMRNGRRCFLVALRLAAPPNRPERAPGRNGWRHPHP
jgi:hypothetical protein